MTTRLRAFIAIALPPQVLLAAGNVQKKLIAAGIRLKWVRPENMHLTLRFLGDIDRRQLPELEAAIGTAAKAAAPFALNAKRIGVFPNLRAPRVVWMGFEGALDSLLQIYQRLAETLHPLGFPPESRAFTGHLTLGRVADRISAPVLQEAVSTAEQIESGIFTVDRICLIKSDLRPTGAVYTRLAEIFLTDTQETPVHTIYRDFHQEES
jgi:RNA 2',3'-cyclic 3'-phosphodiesterase